VILAFRASIKIRRCKLLNNLWSCLTRFGESRRYPVTGQKESLWSCLRKAFSVIFVIGGELRCCQHVERSSLECCAIDYKMLKIKRCEKGKQVTGKDLPAWNRFLHYETSYSRAWSTKGPNCGLHCIMVYENGTWLSLKRCIVQQHDVSTWTRESPSSLRSSTE